MAVRSQAGPSTSSLVTLCPRPSARLWSSWGKASKAQLGLMAEPGWMEVQSSSGPWPRRHTRGGRRGRATVHSRPLEGSLPLKLPGQHPSWGRRLHVGWRSGEGRGEPG